MKRTVLASFTDVLLLPVTIVPRTVGVVGAALTTGGSAAVQGISMLNPQRWASQNTMPSGREGYSNSFGDDKEDAAMFEIGEEEDEEVTTNVPQEKSALIYVFSSLVRLTRP